MKRVLLLILPLLASCAQDEILLFDRHYDSLCGIYNDLTEYAVKIHYSRELSEYTKLRSDALKRYAKDNGIDETLTVTKECADVETLVQAQPNKTPKEVYSDAVAYFMQEMDPHSTYYPEVSEDDVVRYYENKTYTSGMEYKYVSKWVNAAMPVKHLIVDYVYAGSNAYGKIKPGDEILTVNEENVSGKTLEEINQLIYGKETWEKSFEEINAALAAGKVSFTVTTKRNPAPVTLTMQDYQKPLLYTKKKKIDGNTYEVIRMQRILKGSSDQFKTTLMRLMNDHNNEGIILDLRGNSGGYIHEAIRMLEFLVPNHGLIYYTEGNPNKKEWAHLANKKYSINANPIYQKPIMVWVDSETASAAEIMTGVLKSKGVSVVGSSSTFGKAAMQIKMRNSSKNGLGGYIDTTMGMGYYSDNSNHQGDGVVPTHEYTDDRREKALEILKEQDLEPIVHEKNYFNYIHILEKPTKAIPISERVATGSRNLASQFLNELAN